MIAVRGNVGRIFSAEIYVRAAEVVTLGYEAGDEGESSGLYVKEGWKRICILPSISEEQANEIATAVYLKFPAIGKGDGEPGSLLFGNRSELTSLGLSRRE